MPKVTEITEVAKTDEVVKMAEVTEMKFADFYNEKLAAKYDFIRLISMELNEIAGALEKAGLTKKHPGFSEVRDGLKQSGVKHSEAGSRYQQLIKMDAMISVQDAEIMEKVMNDVYGNFITKQELFTKLLNMLKDECMEEAVLYENLMLKIN